MKKLQFVFLPSHQAARVKVVDYLKYKVQSLGLLAVWRQRKRSSGRQTWKPRIRSSWVAAIFQGKCPRTNQEPG
eukprot:scaffold1157_cov122-Cylindrotheca_fusiformis.AAC.8